MKRVLFDLDGVLANLASAICIAVGREYHDSLFCSTKRVWQSLGLTEQTFLDILEYEDVWANIPAYPYAYDLVESAQRLFGEKNVYIASAPSTLASCPGKVRWIEKNLPYRVRDRYVFTRHKRLLSNENTILVDDWRENVAAFKWAVYVPRPWNDAPPVVDTALFIQESLNQFHTAANKVSYETSKDRGLYVHPSRKHGASWAT